MLALIPMQKDVRTDVTYNIATEIRTLARTVRMIELHLNTTHTTAQLR
jgi:hypothetical protein